MSALETAHQAAISLVGDVLARDPLGVDKLARVTTNDLVNLVALGQLSPIDAAQRGKALERADLIAFLRKRQQAAQAVAARSPADADYASALASQIAVEIDMIAQGLHEGEATIASGSEPTE